MTDASSNDIWYDLLTEAEAEVVAEIATHWPRLLMSAPVLLTSADSGLTYTFGTDAAGDPKVPFGHTEIYGRNGGYELFASTYAGGEGDLVFEGTKLRATSARARTFSSGPYARFVATPVALSASQASMIPYKPARMLLVYRACEKFCNLGGFRDPSPFQEMYALAWDGRPGSADVGLSGLFATQYTQQQSPGMRGVGWWRLWLASGGNSGTVAQSASTWSEV